MIIACRDLKKAEEAAREITQETGNEVDTIKLDLASMSSIRQAAEELKQSQPAIHILVNNAGMKHSIIVTIRSNCNHKKTFCRDSQLPSMGNGRWF